MFRIRKTQNTDDLKKRDVTKPNTDHVSVTSLLQETKENAEKNQQPKRSTKSGFSVHTTNNTSADYL